MKSKMEREIEERFARETGQTIGEADRAGTRMLGILIGLSLGAAVGFGLYGIAKLLG